MSSDEIPPILTKNLIVVVLRLDGVDHREAELPFSQVFAEALIFRILFKAKVAVIVTDLKV